MTFLIKGFKCENNKNIQGKLRKEKLRQPGRHYKKTKREIYVAAAISSAKNNSKKEKMLQSQSFRTEEL